MSATNGRTSPSISAAARSSASAVRLAIATLAPSRASAVAIPRPIPLLAAQHEGDATFDPEIHDPVKLPARWR